jgi:hypothetical protein
MPVTFSQGRGPAKEIAMALRSDSSVAILKNEIIEKNSGAAFEVKKG